MNGIALIVFLSAFVLKLVDLVKEKFFIPEYLARWLPLLAVAIGFVISFGIEPVRIFSLLGIEGVAWWLDKVISALVIGLGASFIWDLMDTENRGL